MSAFVFLGPTMAAAEAREVLDAEILPPARAGDICALLHGERQVTAIGLVDGLFQQTAAVWHKEILFALSRGVPVYGASSMGALRAAELAAFGMIGVGEVFEAYQRGTYEDDDEVAVVHGLSEHGHLPLSDPMVNLRHGLALACAAGCIAEAERERLAALAKSWFYPDRSWKRLFREAPEELRRFVERERPDLKRADAVRLLRRMAEDARRGWPRPAVAFDFEPTKYWLALVEAVKKRA